LRSFREDVFRHAGDVEADSKRHGSSGEERGSEDEVDGPSRRPWRVWLRRLGELRDGVKVA
jgi:hypothetical protein